MKALVLFNTNNFKDSEQVYEDYLYRLQGFWTGL